MATNTAIKFYKNAYGLTEGIANVIATSIANPGGIYFDTTTQQIYVEGVAFGGAVADATYANGVLTITKSNGTTQTLDFNDVASADATLKVFQHMNALMGVGTDANNNTVLNYTGANYISTATSLTEADKKLDAAIKAVDDKVVNMDGSASPIVDSTDGDVIKLTINTVSQTDGTIADGSDISTVTFATVAKTGAAGDVSVTTISTGSSATNVQAALEELAGQITAGDVSIDSQRGAFTTDNSMVDVDSDNKVIGVKTDGYITVTSNGVVLDASQVDTAGTSTTDTDLATVKTVQTYISSEIEDLDVTEYAQASIGSGYITIKGIGETDGKLVSTSVSTINVDGTVSSENPLLTKSSLDTVVEGLDVTEYAQAEVGTDAFSVYGIKETNGKIEKGANKVTLAIADGYDASTNKVATKKTVTDAIDTLDTASDVVPVTASDTNTQIKLTLKGIKEENGVIADGTTISTVTFSTVAATGAAADVTVNTTTTYLGSNVDETIQSIDSRITSLEELPKYDVVVLGTEALPTASANTMHKIYLKTEDLTSSNDVYGEYITVRSGEQGSYTYSWEKLGTTAASLDGYVKTINVNGKDFTVDGDTGDKVTLGSVITNITDGDETVTTSNGFTHDYVDSEVTVISTKDATTGTYAASVISTATVKVQAVGTSGDNAKGLAEASDVKAYVGTQISNLNVNSTTVGTNVKVTYSETNGLVTINTTEEYATIGSDLSVTNGSKLVTGNDITKVKEYISTQVSNAIEALDVADTTVSNTNISFHYREDDGKVSIGTLSEKYATVAQTGDATTTAPTLTVSNETGGLVKGTDISTVKTYIDNKVGYEINQLGTSVTSDDAAVATVQVVETAGKISDVVVTTTSANVTVSTETPDLVASNGTGAVTGADIASIKQYIDAKAAEATAGVNVQNANATIPVGTDVAATTLGTVNGTAITAKVSYTWEEYQ